MDTGIEGIMSARRLSDRLAKLILGHVGAIAHEKLEAALCTLTSREAIILRQRFSQGLRLGVIADNLSMSVKKVRRIEHVALRKMRHPTRLRYLEASS